MPIRYSGRQFLYTEKAINPRSELTIEAILTLEGDGENPSILSLPTSSASKASNFVYRLGFRGSSRIPEFQLLIEGDDEPTTVIGPSPIKPYRQFHVAGTYDGKNVRLYVDGVEVADAKNEGLVAVSKERTVLGAQSSIEPTGFLIALVYEIRFFQRARTPEQIFEWRNKPLPPPRGDDCIGLWTAF